MDPIQKPYELYDYDRLPREIEEECLFLVNHYKPFFTIPPDAPQQCLFELFHPSPSLHEWCISSSNPFGNNFRIAVQRMSGGNRLWPHVDGKLEPENDIYPRPFAINYLLSPSGPTTEWYHSNDINSVYESVLIPSHKWHKIRTDILHGVRDIEEPRIAITMVRNWSAEDILKYKKEYYDFSYVS